MNQERVYIQELLKEYGDIEKAKEEYLCYVGERLERIDNKLDWSCASDEFVEETITLLEAIQDIKIDDSIEKFFRVGATSKEILEYLKLNLKENETAKDLFANFFDKEVNN